MFDLIAHRGSSAHFPENTLEAFRAAKHSGADCVEFDVMLTNDGEAIIFHDETLDRTTNGTGYVGDCTLEYIKTLDAGSWFNPSFQSIHVPTLIESIQLLTELNLNANIELKPCGDTAVQTTQVALELVKKYWPKDKKPPLISSAHLQCLEEAYRDYPEYPRALLLDEWEEDCCDRAKKYDCFSINICHESLTSERVIKIKDAGFFVYAFTVNKRSQAENLKQLGVDGIFSDYPQLLWDHKLLILLEKLADKAIDLEERGEVKALIAAKALHEQLLTNFEKYMAEPIKNKAVFGVMKEKIDAAILQARPELARHRSVWWNDFTANLAMHIALLACTFGVGNVVALSYNYYHSSHQPGNPSMFFKMTTDSNQHIKNIEETVGRLEVNLSM
ncbi:MAG: glycerophosphodiester phosphodiesterase family protein [Legionellaceae bacterium]|nr:glycerophosphodiester phosphodiesterase family protein [Legionellaceae bacterium]